MQLAISEIPGGRIGESPRIRTSLASRLIAVLVHMGVWSVILAVCVVAIPAGLELRRWTWDQSAGMHFEGDIQNGYNWGTIAARDGVIATFRKLDAEHNAEAMPDYGLDYPPLRLVIMSRWAAWTQRHFPGVTSWDPSYKFNAPMLQLNSLAELLSALAAFLLVRHWVRRGQEAESGKRSYAGSIAGLMAGLILWFNPGVIVDGHSWPQWDIWIVPFFLFSALLASMDYWFFAGMLIPLGAMFKGQILLAAPVLVLWPIFSWRWGAVFRMLSGCAIALAAVGVPWLIVSATACWWVVSVFLATIVTLIPVITHNRRPGFLVACWILAAGLLAWPLFKQDWPTVRIGLLLMIVMMLAFYRLPVRWTPYVIFLPMAAAAFLCLPLFGGSLGWLKVGFGYGIRKHLAMGSVGTNNLAMILNVSYGWQLLGPDGTLHLPLPIPGMAPLAITMKMLLRIIYLVTLILCGLGASIQARRNDPRFLVAIAAPWILFFALLPQMNNRYLVWGAAIPALMAGVSVGMTLLGLLLSACCASMMIDIMCRVHPGAYPALERLLHPQHPAISWMILLIAAIFLYVGLAPRKRASARLTTAIAG